MIDVPSRTLFDEPSPLAGHDTPPAPARPAPAVWSFTWEAGPDSGGTGVLGPGAHVIGRASGASVRCDDTTLEPHHALLTIGDDGEVTVDQLCGRVPIRLDGEPLEGRLALRRETRLDIARSRLVVSPGPAFAPPSTTGLVTGVQPTAPSSSTRRHTVVRPARTLPQWNRPAPVPPATADVRHDLPGGLVMALVGLVLAGVIAFTLGQPIFLLFGAMGSVATIGAWVVARLRARRAGRVGKVRNARARREFELALARHLAERRDHLVASTMSLTEATRLVECDAIALWQRRREHDDAFAVSIGVGDVEWQPVPGPSPTVHHDTLLPVTAPQVLNDVPIVATLGPGARLAVSGAPADAHAVARALLLQLAVNCGPADLRVIVVTEAPDDWAALAPLPHLRGADAGLIVTETDLAEALAPFAALDHATRPHIVVVVDEAAVLTALTGPVRRALADESLALLVITQPGGAIPHLCTAQLLLGGASGGPPTARWFDDTTSPSLPQAARVAGLGITATRRLADLLSTVIDPEDPLGAAGAIPRRVDLGELLAQSLREAPTAAAIAAAWRAGGHDPSPRTPLGIAADGVVDLDLVRDGPHGLLAGTTGSGKSELLRSLVIGLAATSSPDHLTFVLVDYKGGATFDGCVALPHVVGVVTDLDDRLVDRALRSLHAELRSRESLLREHGAADLTMLRSVAPQVRMPRLVVVIDEFAALVAEQPDFLHALLGIAQRGRSLGVHLLLATQRPAGVISDDIRANTNLRIALRLHDSSDATDVIGDIGPTTFGRHQAGRAMMRLGPTELVTFQTACCTAPPTGDATTDLQRLVVAIRDAARLVGTTTPHAPWLPPLPERVERDSGWTRNQVGIVDDPDGQCRRPLVLDAAAGNLLIAGHAGMGSSTALLTVAADIAGWHAAVPRHLYVIDASNGDDRLAALDGTTYCAAAVRLHERERLGRLLHRLDTAVRQRRTAPCVDQPPIALLIDGLDRLRHELDDPATAEQLDMLERILAAAPDTLLVAASTRRFGALSPAWLAAFPQRWVLHLTDPHDAAAVGVAAKAVVGAVPGRCVDARSGLEAQLLFSGDSLPEDLDDGGQVPTVGSRRPTPAPIRCLPAELDATLLDSATSSDECTELPFGVAFVSGCSAALAIPDGEHALVLGPSRSGRTTTLVRLVTAWRQAHRGGRVVVVQPRRQGGAAARHLARLGDAVTDPIRALAEPCSSVATLLVVDDAELVDDPGGALATILASCRAGLTVIAAAKPDALRQSYGHWTAVVRRSRLGLVAASGGDLDGDLLGVMLPRRLPIAPRPGLLWLVDNGTTTLAQAAMDAADAADPVDAAGVAGGHLRAPADQARPSVGIAARPVGFPLRPVFDKM